MDITPNRNWIALVFAIVIVSGFDTSLEAAPGDLDPTFGTGGIVTTHAAPSNCACSSEVKAIAIQPDGKIVAAGSAQQDISQSDFALARYNPDGSLDVTFGVGGIVTTDVESMSDDGGTGLVIQSDGKIVVAGDVRFSDSKVFALVRYNPNGTLDTTFGTAGKLIENLGSGSATMTGLAIQPDGKLIVAGWISSPLGGTDFALARLNSDGSLDTAFGVNGKVQTDLGSSSDVVWSVALQADGKIILAGSSSPAGGDFALARYNNDGSLDMTFGTSGKVNTDFGGSDGAEAVTVQDDGKIVVAGGARIVGNRQDFALARYNSDGTLDNSFGIGGKVTSFIVPAPSNNIAEAVAVQGNGMIVFAGWATFPNHVFAVGRLNTDGTLDTSFGTGGMLTTPGGGNDFAYALAIQADGKLVVGGSVTVGNHSDFGLARYLGDDVPPIFNVTPPSQNFGILPLSSVNELTFTVRNTGSGILTGAASTGAPLSIFGDSTFGLATNETKTIIVRFTPTSAGVTNGFISFTTNGGDSSLPVTGTAIPAVVRERFSVTDLGDLPGGKDESSAVGINNAGVVVGVGNAECGNLNAIKPFIWTSVSGMQVLGPFPVLDVSGTTVISCGGYAAGINDQGQVVGVLGYGAFGERPFIWTAENGMQLIDPDLVATAHDINNAGQVVGLVGITSAFRWTVAGGVESLAIPAQFTNAFAINNLGEVAGSAGIESCNTGPVIWNAARQQINDRPRSLSLDGLIAALPPSRFLCGGRALGINDSGDAVGSAALQFISGDSGVFAFKWFARNNEAISLGELPHTGSRFTEASGINNIGDVVGTSNERAFLWTADKGMQDLNGLLDANGTGWILFSAYAINDVGQIVGYGLHNGVIRGFLLTPVPVTTPTPVLAVNPSSLNFTNVNVGSSEDHTFTVQNTGGGTLTGSASASAPFSIVGTNSFSLAANQTAPITVRFSPTAAVSSNAFVNFTSNGGNAALAVTGVGVLVATVDTDGDGMPDVFEVAHGLNPNDPSDAANDLDNDGLSNLDEFRRRTHPLIADTDGDGFSDGREVLAGSNPLSAFSFPSPVILTRPALPVVFVHGICSDATTWNTLKNSLEDLGWHFGGTVRAVADDLKDHEADADFYFIQFEDRLIRKGLEKWGSELADSLAKIKRFRGLPETKFIIVAHSAGGLAARAYVQSLSSRYQGDIHHLITYGTPHLGTAIAHWEWLSSSTFGGCREFESSDLFNSQGVREMDTENQLSFLRRLNSAPFPGGIQFTSLIGQAQTVACPIVLFETDCVVSIRSQNILNIPNPPSEETVETRKTSRRHDFQTSDVSKILWAIGRTGIFEGEGETIHGVDRIAMTVASPVDIIVTDPLGRSIGKVFNEIPFASYEEIEDTPGHRLDLVTIPLAEIGSYAINVIPETGALSSDTFTITAIVNEEPISIADRVRVADIPQQGYILSLLPENKAPTAIAGLYQTVRLGSLVRLDGTQSFDLDNGASPLSYSWTKVSGSAINLAGATTANPTFTAAVVGTYTFNLVVNDGQDDSAADSVLITVPSQGDIDLDGDVDNNDLSRITSVLNTKVNGPNDLRDLNGDGKIDALDSRILVTRCTRPRCATQ